MIKWLLWPRQAGKTYRTAEWVKADPKRTVLCHDRDSANRMHRQFGVPEDQIITPWDIGNGNVWRKPTSTGRAELAIDNLELILDYLVGPNVDVKLVTGTIASEKSKLMLCPCGLPEEHIYAYHRGFRSWDHKDADL